MTKLETVVSEKFSACLSDYQTGLRQNWHSHREFILVMNLRGNVREQVNCEETLINAFDIGVKAPDVRHTDHFCPTGVRVIRLSLSPEFVAELKNRNLINEGWYWIKFSNAIRPFLRVGQALLEQRTDIEEDVYELLAAILSNKKADIKHPPFWLRRAKQQLDETCFEGVRLSQLAGDAGVHPVYFARKFQQFYGMAVGSYVRYLQFQKVQSMIVSGKYNLAQIAVEAGFYDQPHLTRTFAGEFGITPHSFRKLLQ